MRLGLLCLMVLMTFKSGHVLAAQITKTTLAFPGRVEIHVQPEIGELDVLFVVDDSGSMTEHQMNLIKNIPSLTKAALHNGVHVHAGVTTTSLECGFSTVCAGQFNGAKKTADSLEPDFLTVLEQNLNVGNQGNSAEQPLDTLVAALSEPNLTKDHPGFLRPSAHLAVVVLTDADDQSLVQDPQSVVNFLKGLKSSPSQVSLSSIQVLSNDRTCATSEERGGRLESTVRSLNGKLISLCAPDFGGQLGQLGDGIVSRVAREVPLTAIPDFNSIVVTFGSTVLAGGDIHYGWVYDSNTNIVILGDKINWSAMRGKELIVSFIPKDWK